MSNNAVYAYNNYEMPKSKWNKRRIFEAIEFEIKSNNAWFEITEEVISELQKLPLKILYKYILEYRSWHHTSKYFNQTDFYGINLNNLEELTVEEIRKIPIYEKARNEYINSLYSYESFYKYIKDNNLENIHSLEKNNF